VSLGVLLDVPKRVFEVTTARSIAASQCVPVLDRLGQGRDASGIDALRDHSRTDICTLLRRNRVAGVWTLVPRIKIISGGNLIKICVG